MLRVKRPSFMRALTLILCAMALLLLAPVCVEAQQHPITWSLVAPPNTVVQGTAFTVRLHAVIPPGWHLYSLTQPPGGPVPTVISVAAGSPFALSGRVKAPEPEVAADRNFDILTETYADSVTFTVRVLARSAGATKLALAIVYQTCTDRFCLPPATENVETPITVAAAAPGTVIAALPPPINAPITAPFLPPKTAPINAPAPPPAPMFILPLCF